jgi:hypothetical protein
MGYEYTEDFLDLLCVMGSGVVDERVAIALGVCAEMVGVFLLQLAYGMTEVKVSTYLGDGDSVLREAQAVAKLGNLVNSD